MALSLENSKITYGLSATAAATSINTSGDFTLGIDPTVLLLSATNGFSFGGCIYGSGDGLSLTVSTGTATGDTFVAGNAQVETATAAGTVTGSGNATVVFTSAAVTGSPVTVSVSVTNGDTPTVWAGKVRTALAANTAIAAAFTISGSTTSIVATRKATTIRDDCPVSYYANDGTLNISLDNGTCTGITTAGTSANTTAGVATSGVYLLKGDGKDMEGNTLTTLTEIRGMLVSCDSGGIYMSAPEYTVVIPSGAFIEMGSASAMPTLLDTVAIYSTADNASFRATFLGQ